MAKYVFDEQRASDRLEMKLQVRCFYSFLPWPSDLLSTKNISGEGVCFFVRKPLRKGKRIRLDIFMPSAIRQISCVSAVVWCQKTLGMTGAGYEIGLKFIQIAARDQARFTYLFCDLMLNYYLSLTKDG